MQTLINELRPQKITDIIGQQHLIGKNKVLTKIVESKKMFSFILYGPPGTGKTSIANALANELDYKFKILNAVNCSKKDLTTVIEESKRFKKVLLLLDEFHRLTKPMQDILLPEIEYDNIYIFHCYPNILDSNEEHQNFEKENRNSVFAFSKDGNIIWFFSNGAKILKEKSRENLLIIYDDNWRYLVDVSSGVIINKVPHF